MTFPALTALLLVGLIASVTATNDPTDMSKCHVDWFRVVVPGKMVYAWNCICDADDGTPFVSGGARQASLEFEDTSGKQIHYAVGCFNYMYQKHNLLAVCQQTPGKFMEKAQPFLEQCTTGSENYDPSNNGPFRYSRDTCVSQASQARQVGMTMIAAVHICQCTQPWGRHGGPPTYVLDGRAPFPVPISTSRPDVVDHMMVCMEPYEDVLQYLCTNEPHYYTEMTRLMYSICCEKINRHTPGTKLDCKAIAAMS